MRKVVGSLLISAVTASVFSFGPALSGIYVRDQGMKLYGWDAWSYFWGPAFLMTLGFIALSAILISILDWMMGD